MCKICQISGSFPPVKDGVGDFVYKLTRLLLKENVSNCVITSKYEGELTNVFPIIKNWDLNNVIEIINKIKKENCKTVIWHYPGLTYGKKLVITLFPLFMFIMGIKVIIYLHEFSIYSRLGKLRILMMVVFASKIITTDKNNMKELSNWGLEKRVSIIPGGANIDEEIIKNYKRKVIYTDKKKNVLYFGFIKSGKGLENLIDLFLTNDWVKSKFVLHIVGSAPEKPDLATKNLLDVIKKNDVVKYHGFLDWFKFINLLNFIDFGLLPFTNGASEKRGSLMTLFALGIPVLTTKPKIEISGLRNSKNIIFIDNDNNESILKGLREINNLNYNEIYEIGQSAKQWYMETYSESKILSQLLTIINKKNE